MTVDSAIPFPIPTSGGLKLEFLQYLRPNGDTRRVDIERPQDIEDMYDELLTVGISFEIEQLGDGKIFMDSMDTQRDEITNRLCANDQEVPMNVDSLIKETHRRVFE